MVSKSLRDRLSPNERRSTKLTLLAAAIGGLAIVAVSGVYPIDRKHIQKNMRQNYIFVEVPVLRSVSPDITIGLDNEDVIPSEGTTDYETVLTILDRVSGKHEKFLYTKYPNGTSILNYETSPEGNIRRYVIVDGEKHYFD
jgi:hypothetical protein